jgi:sigma-B regulation protein RsbU (phosphoserine phosphatase)
MQDDVEKPHALVCAEVWGGNRKVIRTVKMPGLLAWVGSLPIHEGEGGGDLHYMSVCDYDLISRIALADVTGHGREVDRVTQMLRKLMLKNINAWDQSDFMRGLNEAFGQGEDNQYATAIVLSFHRLMGRLAFSNAGHLPPLWYHAAQKSWGWLEEGSETKKISGLPVGMMPGTEYSQTVVALKRGDILVLYTDGITEARDSIGYELGRDGFLKWAREAPIDSPTALGENLLQRLESFRGNSKNDDETLLVVQREEESLPPILGVVANEGPAVQVVAELASVLGRKLGTRQ